jgi:hypothetical protein
MHALNSPTHLRRGDLHRLAGRRAGLHHPRRRDFDHGHRRLRAAQGGALGQGPEIVTTWIITIPAAAFVAAVIYALIQALIRRGQLL